MSNAEPECVMHVLGDFRLAGAERFAANMLLHHDRSKYTPVGVCLYRKLGTSIEAELGGAGIEVHYLEKGERAGWEPVRKLRALFKQYRPVAVNTHMDGLQYAFFSMIQERVPARVHTLHNLAEKEGTNRGGRFFRWLAFKARIGGIAPVSIAREVQDSVKRFYGNIDSPLIMNGVPVARYQTPEGTGATWREANGFCPECPLLLHIGRFMSQKNHEMLLRSFARVVKEHPSAVLAMAGWGELEDQTRTLANELGLGESARFLGQRNDVPEMLAACDALLLPSHYEGNPLVVMEAMAAGRPVIATAVGGVPELIEHRVSGLLMPPGDEVAFAAAVTDLLTNQEKRLNMGLAARQRADERFDIRHTVKAYEALYERLREAR